MKAQLLVLSAVGLLLAAAPLSPAQANPASGARYVAATTADAEARLAERSVDLAGQSLSVRVGIGADRLSSVRVVKSSGSPDLDSRAVAALRNLRTDVAPAELVGREMTITLGEDAPSPAVAAR